MRFGYPFSFADLVSNIQCNFSLLNKIYIESHIFVRGLRRVWEQEKKWSAMFSDSFCCPTKQFFLLQFFAHIFSKLNGPHAIRAIDLLWTTNRWRDHLVIFISDIKKESFWIFLLPFHTLHTFLPFRSTYIYSVLMFFGFTVFCITYIYMHFDLFFFVVIHSFKWRLLLLVSAKNRFSSWMWNVNRKTTTTQRFHRMAIM